MRQMSGLRRILSTSAAVGLALSGVALGAAPANAMRLTSSTAITATPVNSSVDGGTGTTINVRVQVCDYMPNSGCVAPVGFFDALTGTSSDTTTNFYWKSSANPGVWTPITLTAATAGSNGTSTDYATGSIDTGNLSAPTTFTFAVGPIPEGGSQPNPWYALINNASSTIAMFPGETDSTTIDINSTVHDPGFPTGQEGVPYDSTIAVSDFTTFFDWTNGGSNVTLSGLDATGLSYEITNTNVTGQSPRVRIFGTPTANGNFSLTIDVTDPNGKTASGTGSLDILPASSSSLRPTHIGPGASTTFSWTSPFVGTYVAYFDPDTHNIIGDPIALGEVTSMSIAWDHFSSWGDIASSRYVEVREYNSANKSNLDTPITWSTPYDNSDELTLDPITLSFSPNPTRPGQIAAASYDGPGNLTFCYFFTTFAPITPAACDNSSLLNGKTWSYDALNAAHGRFFADLPIGVTVYTKTFDAGDLSRTSVAGLTPLITSYLTIAADNTAQFTASQLDPGQSVDLTWTGGNDVAYVVGFLDGFVVYTHSVAPSATSLTVNWSDLSDTTNPLGQRTVDFRTYTATQLANFGDTPISFSSPYDAMTNLAFAPHVTASFNPADVGPGGSSTLTYAGPDGQLACVSASDPQGGAPYFHCNSLGNFASSPWFYSTWDGDPFAFTSPVTFTVTVYDRPFEDGDQTLTNADGLTELTSTSVTFSQHNVAQFDKSEIHAHQSATLSWTGPNSVAEVYGFLNGSVVYASPIGESASIPVSWTDLFETDTSTSRAVEFRTYTYDQQAARDGVYPTLSSPYDASASLTFAPDATISFSSENIGPGGLGTVTYTGPNNLLVCWTVRGYPQQNDCVTSQASGGVWFPYDLVESYWTSGGRFTSGTIITMTVYDYPYNGDGGTPSTDGLFAISTSALTLNEHNTASFDTDLIKNGDTGTLTWSGPNDVAEIVGFLGADVVYSHSAESGDTHLNVNWNDITGGDTSTTRTVEFRTYTAADTAHLTGLPTKTDSYDAMTAVDFGPLVVPKLQATEIKAGYVGAWYSDTVDVGPLASGFNWTYGGGVHIDGLPSGMAYSVNSSEGVAPTFTITGFPTISGNTDLTVTVTDDYGDSAFTTITLNIYDPEQMDLSVPASRTMWVGMPYDEIIPAPTGTGWNWSAGGSSAIDGLPAGLTTTLLTPDGCSALAEGWVSCAPQIEISGTPTAAGHDSMLWTTRSATGQWGIVELPYDVKTPTMSFTPDTLSAGQSTDFAMSGPVGRLLCIETLPNDSNSGWCGSADSAAMSQSVTYENLEFLVGRVTATLHLRLVLYTADGTDSGPMSTAGFTPLVSAPITLNPHNTAQFDKESISHGESSVLTWAGSNDVAEVMGFAGDATVYSHAIGGDQTSLTVAWSDISGIDMTQTRTVTFRTFTKAQLNALNPTAIRSHAVHPALRLPLVSSAYDAQALLNFNGFTPTAPSDPNRQTINGSASTTFDVIGVPEGAAITPGENAVGVTAVEVDGTSVHVAFAPSFSGAVDQVVTVTLGGNTWTVHLRANVMPKIVTRPTFTITLAKTLVRWTPSANATGYRVMLGSKVLCTVSAKATSCTVPGLYGPKSALKIVSLGGNSLTATTSASYAKPPSTVYSSGVVFGPDSSALTATAKNQLHAFAVEVAKQGFTTVTVKGFAAHFASSTSAADAAHRTAVAKARAAAVRAYLITQFKSLNAKVTVTSLGATSQSPAVGNLPASSPLNRRADMSVS